MLPKVVHSTLPFFVHCKFARYIKLVQNFKLYRQSNQVLIEYNPKQIAYSELAAKVKNAGFILE